MLAQLLQQILHGAAGAEQLAVQQRQIVALIDGKAVKIGVAGGIGDLSGGHRLGGSHHGLSNRLGIGFVRIEAHHGGDALRHGGSGDHHDLLLCQARALLGRHDDVLVVGQDKHHFAGGAVDLLENRLGGGVHGLTAGHNGVHAQRPEGVRKTVSGAYSHEAVPLFRGSHGVFLIFQLLLHSVQIVGAVGLTAGCQIVPLGAHILNLGQLQRAVLLGLCQGIAGNIGVNVDLEALVVLTDHQTVADAVQIGTQGLQ